MKSTPPNRRDISHAQSKPWLEELETRLHLSAAPVTFTDNDGTEVRITLSGNGSLTLENTEQGRVVTTNGTDQRSVLKMTTKGGDKIADIHAINIVGGAIKTIDAPKINLTGDLTIAGSARTVKLGNLNAVTQQHITIGGTDQARAMDIKLGLVSDLTINSGTPLKIVDVSDWDDTGSDDLITAPWITKINSRGDFAAGLRIGDEDDPSLALKEAKVTDSISGVWAIEGSVKKITAGSVASGFSANATLDIDYVKVSDDFSGTIAANSFGRIYVYGNVTNAKILAGADLGSDAKLGGSGDDQDLFSRGVMSRVYIRKEATDSFIAAGLDPVNGVFGDGDDFVTGKRYSVIKSLNVSGTANQIKGFAAGLFPRTVKIGGTSTEPAGDPRFLIGDIKADDDPPVINATLEDIDGQEDDVLITSSPSVIGRVTDLGRVSAFTLKILTRKTTGTNVTETESNYSSIYRLIEPNGTFTIERSKLEQINGSTPFEASQGLTQVQYTIVLTAKDENGNNSPLYSIKFKFQP